MKMMWNSWIFLLTLTQCAPTGIIAEDNMCDLPNTEHGKIAQYYYNFKNFYFPMSQGMKLSLSCAAGYTTAAGSQEDKIVCTQSGWSPAPKCFRKCSKPLLDNGFVISTQESYKIMEKTEYRCIPGYITLRGTEQEEMMCLSERWSPEPSCYKKSDTCGAPDLPHGHYATAQKKFKISDKLRYTCEDGYHTNTGSTAGEVECLSYGWSSTPQCIELSCPGFQSIEHGDFHPKKRVYADGDVVQFSCEENYSLNGSELIQCYYFGWSPDLPRCEDTRNKCPPPPQIPHSNRLLITRSYRNGDVIYLECYEKYEMKGSPEIQCVNGAWTSPPNCIEIRENMTCNELPSIENGGPILTAEMYYSGDILQYRCKHGYEIFGPNEIQCKRGKWQPPPQCIESNEQCSPPPSIRNGDIVEPILTGYRTGSSVEYRCHNYHLMEGSRTVHCEQGVWSALPVCLEPCTIDTDEIGTKNVKLLWSYETRVHSLHGDIIEFTCNEGFVLAKNYLKAQCVNGTLKYPECIKKGEDGGCGHPPAIQNGSIESPLTSYSTGSSVDYTCFEHHFLQGSRSIYCMNNGQWTIPPTCIEPCVLSLEEMNNNNLELRWSFDNRPYFFHGDYIEFKCKKGFHSTPSAGISGIRIQCMFGHLKYPKCT